MPALISQHHAEGKQEQIGAMADIYGYALLTIVALGDNADAGLEGVTAVRKHCQPSVSVGDQKLVWGMPVLEQCLRSSIWSTRAWTYQEALLSSRCLIITKYQFFFVCGLGTICEAFPDLGCIQVRSACSWSENILNPSMLLPSKARDGDALIRFKQHLDEYRQRKLGYESDTLNAFRGILAKSEVRSYWGVPLFKKVPSGPLDKRRKLPASGAEDRSIPPDLGLIYGLLWEIYETELPSRPRRPGFPSWTWASTAHQDIRFFRRRWVGADDLPLVHAQIRLASEHTHAVQNFNDVATLSANSIITEHGQCLLLTSFVASCMLKLDDDLGANQVQCWVNAPFLHSNRSDLGRLDPEGYEELRTNHGAFGDGGSGKCECEAIMMFRHAQDIGWMLIIRKSDVYVRLGIMHCLKWHPKETWAPTPLEQTTIKLH